MTKKQYGNPKKKRNAKTVTNKYRATLKKINQLRRKIKNFDKISKNYSDKKKFKEYMKIYSSLVKLSKEVNKLEQYN